MVSKTCGLTMEKSYSKKMVATVQKYFIVKWDKRQFVLWKRGDFVWTLYFFI